MVWERQCLEGFEQKDHLLNEWMNYKGVYRTALATMGLLNIVYILFMFVLLDPKALYTLDTFSVYGHIYVGKHLVTYRHFCTLFWIFWCLLQTNYFN